MRNPLSCHAPLARVRNRSHVRSKSPSGVLGSSAMRKSSLAQMRVLARQRDGKCISKRYVSSRIPLRWRCRCGHQWNATPTNVSKGSWCPTCAHRKRLTLGEMRALAERRGGECLSERYVNNETKLRWRCAAGHEWETAPGLVKGSVRQNKSSASKGEHDSGCRRVAEASRTEDQRPVRVSRKRQPGVPNWKCQKGA